MKSGSVQQVAFRANSRASTSKKIHQLHPIKKEEEKKSDECNSTAVVSPQVGITADHYQRRERLVYPIGSDWQSLRVVIAKAYIDIHKLDENASQRFRKFQKRRPND